MARRLTTALALLFQLVAWAPRAAPLALTACQCPPRGTAVVYDEATTEREPTFSVSGPACEAKDVVCQHRDPKDRCDVFWIEPPVV